MILELGSYGYNNLQEEENNYFRTKELERKYVPTKKQVEESKKRMTILGIEVTEKLKMNIGSCIRELDETDLDLKNAINDFETKHNSYVYYIIFNKTAYGMLYSFLFVGKEDDEWVYDWEYMKENLCFVYVYNQSCKQNSEFGTILIEKNKKNKSIERVG